MSALSVLLVLGICAPSVIFNLNRYRVWRLSLEMTRAQVETALMGAPDCETRVGRATVLYFPAPVGRTFLLKGGAFACSDVARAYTATEDLPWPYGAILVVLDGEGRVAAFVYVGEGIEQTRKKNGVAETPTFSAVLQAELER